MAGASTALSATKGSLQSIPGAGLCVLCQPTGSEMEPGQFSKVYWPLGSNRPHLLWRTETAVQVLSMPRPDRVRPSSTPDASEGVARC